MKPRIVALMLLASMLLLVSLVPAVTAQPDTPEYPAVPESILEMHESRSMQNRQAPGIRSSAGPEATFSGWFTIIWGDHAPGSRQEGSIKYTLHTDDNNKYDLLLDEKSSVTPGQLLALNGQHVELRGAVTTADRVAGENADILVSTMTAVEGDGPAASDAADSLANSLWVSIACKFSDVADEPKNLAYFQGMYDTNHPGLDHYWPEMSYDAVGVDGSEAYGWYTLPYPQSHYVDLDNGSAELAELFYDCTAAADADVDFTEFEGINLMFNESLGCCAWGGGMGALLDGEDRGWRTTWEPPWAYENIGVFYHEMGHGFGMPHSSGDYGQVYDNAWDVMSGLWYNCEFNEDPVYGCIGQGTIAYHRDLVGWLPSGQTYTAGLGSHTITLERLNLPQTNNYLMAKIPINESSGSYFTVEVRGWDGYDEKLPGEAVIIHEVRGSRSEPAHVVDIDYNEDTADAGAMWTVGETFTGMGGDITVEILSATATGYVIAIENNSEAPIDTYEPNDAPEEATPIAYDDVVEEAYISWPGDQDFYVFTGNQGDVIEAVIDAQSQDSLLDSNLYLYNSDMDLLAENGDYNGLDSYLNFQLPEDGDYYLLVQEYNHENEGDIDYFYTLSLDKSEAWQGAWFYPTADAYVDEAKKAVNFGSAAFLRVKNAGKDMNAYIKYDVDAFYPDPGSCYEFGWSALVSHVTEPGNDGGNIYLVGNGWNENTINWNNAPAITGGALGGFGEVSYDTTAWGYMGNPVTENGVYSFAIRNNSTNSVDFSSREGPYHPWLYVTYRNDNPANLSADFSISSWSGLAPHTVQFTDYSTGCPTTWEWDFGDGTTSNLRNPSHTYTTPGHYAGSLTVSNDVGSSTLYFDYINVAEPPTTTYLSLAKKATVGGLVVEPADIVRYQKATNTWKMVYDGSVRGTKANISSFAWDGNDLLLVFAGKQVITGLGTATQYDVVRFSPNTPGIFPLGAGVFSWEWRGANYGLTTGKEKIDALSAPYSDSGDLIISTSGAASLPGGLNPADEDLVYWVSWAGDWVWIELDGSTIPGMAAKNVIGAWYDDQVYDSYVVLNGKFNLGGVTGNDSNIARVYWNGSGYALSLHEWLAPGAVFKGKIDAIELSRQSVMIEE